MSHEEVRKCARFFLVKFLLSQLYAYVPRKNPIYGAMCQPNMSVSDLGVTYWPTGMDRRVRVLKGYGTLQPVPVPGRVRVPRPVRVTHTRDTA